MPSVLQQYLDGSQEYPSSGNIMYNLLDGAAPTDKLVYGENNANNENIPIPKLLSQTLQQQGTLFKEVNYSLSKLIRASSDTSSPAIRIRSLNLTRWGEV